MWDINKFQHARLVEVEDEERGDCYACQGTGIATSGDPDGDCRTCRGTGLESLIDDEDYHDA
tara:strand:- start:116 stop:301 length:186 start_codon:yes stop_codon:yes gene_type:complete